MSRLPAAKRREQLLDTAAKLFALHGYAGATTSEIAKAAGVTEPIIYRHFPSKRELFIALIERTGEQTIKLWEHELRTAPDPAERLKRLIRANPMVTNRGRGLYRVIVTAMTEVEDPKIQEALNNHIQMLHQFLTKEVERAQEHHQVSARFSPGITAWALIDMGVGYGVLSAMAISQHGFDQRGMHISDLLGELMLGDRYKRASEGTGGGSKPDAKPGEGDAE
jgi:TetR/AcrR family transcriptional regulator